MRLRYGFHLFGYVIMPEHVHLLLTEPKKALLSKTLQALKLSVSVRTSKHPFWQTRYYDFNVSNHDKYTEKAHYIHQNPVARGLVTHPEDYGWSSFPHYATGEPGLIEIESHWTATRRERAKSALLAK